MKEKIGYPAHAGIDHTLDIIVLQVYRLPRTRGDRPCFTWTKSKKPQATPHTRGSTCGDYCLFYTEEGYPAHAGIDPDIAEAPRMWRRLPRTRGDRPRSLLVLCRASVATPHTRGSTSSGCTCHIRS